MYRSIYVVGLELQLHYHFKVALLVCKTSQPQRRGLGESKALEGQVGTGTRADSPSPLHPCSLVPQVPCHPSPLQLFLLLSPGSHLLSKLTKFFSASGPLHLQGSPVPLDPSSA